MLIYMATCFVTISYYNVSHDETDETLETLFRISISILKLNIQDFFHQPSPTPKNVSRKNKEVTLFFPIPGFHNKFSLYYPGLDDNILLASLEAQSRALLRGCKDFPG
ncbi:hypothetical protein DRQ05_06090 [bacterium]|nr:MAG: hypothetical protein DRQ05_06090 [bacterium]